MRSTAFVKITAVYGQIDENWEFVRKWYSRKVPITDKMLKNSLLSVKIQPVWTRFYGQITGKCQFVRKMRFDYGQIGQNGHFVRKI